MAINREALFLFSLLLATRYNTRSVLLTANLSTRNLAESVNRIAAGNSSESARLLQVERTAKHAPMVIFQNL